MADNHFEAAPEGGVKLKDEQPKVQDVKAPETAPAEEAKPETAAPESTPEAGAENRTEETAAEAKAEDSTAPAEADAEPEDEKPEDTE